MIRNASYILSSILFFLLTGSDCFTQKPLVWIYTDMTDNTLPGKNVMGTINDPDDISAMAGYLLMCNMFDTRGIVVGSTYRPEHSKTPHQGDWANRVVGGAYRSDVGKLNKFIGGYPEDIEFTQSCIKESAERYQPDKVYLSLDDYSTVKSLFQEAESLTDPGSGTAGPINVLIWGLTTEPAILVNHCMATQRTDILDRLRFIAHWTNSSVNLKNNQGPVDVYNCRQDAEACAYLKRMALNGHIRYYECGAIGQFGIVSGGPKGKEYFNKFRSSHLGRLFVDAKYMDDCVDHSDAATYWTLLGNWGVCLDDIKGNGTNYPEVEKRNKESFIAWSERIHDELLRRSLLAGQQ